MKPKWMWELDCEEGWGPKNWCFWTVVLEKTLESPLDCKEIQPVHFKDQPWIFFGRNDPKAETPVLWPPHAKSWLIGKDCDAGRDGGQEEKGTTEDEMAGWHHRLNGCESEWTLGVGDGQGGLVCCDSRDHKELDTTEWLNWTELIQHVKQKMLHVVFEVMSEFAFFNQCVMSNEFLWLWNLYSAQFSLYINQTFVASTQIKMYTITRNFLCILLDITFPQLLQREPFWCS